MSPDDEAGREAPSSKTDPFVGLSSEDIELSKAGVVPAVVEAPPEPSLISADESRGARVWWSDDSATTTRAAVARRRADLKAELAAIQEKLPRKAFPIALMAVGGATFWSSVVGLFIASYQYRGPNMVSVTNCGGFTFSFNCSGTHLEPRRPWLAEDWIGPTVGLAALAVGITWLMVVMAQRRHLEAPISDALDLLDDEEEATDALRLTAPPPSSRLPAIPMQLQIPVARF